jgi:hypothetical protein
MWQFSKVLDSTPDGFVGGEIEMKRSVSILSDRQGGLLGVERFRSAVEYICVFVSCCYFVISD